MQYIQRSMHHTCTLRFMYTVRTRLCFHHHHIHRTILYYYACVHMYLKQKSQEEETYPKSVRHVGVKIVLLAIGSDQHRSFACTLLHAILLVCHIQYSTCCAVGVCTHWSSDAGQVPLSCIYTYAY